MTEPTRAQLKEPELQARFMVDEAERQHGAGWSRLSSFQRGDAIAAELLSFLESITPETLEELFGSVPTIQVIQEIIRHTYELRSQD